MIDQLSLNKYLTLIVKGIRNETEDVRRIELGDPEDWDLPRFSAGAHIDVYLTDDLVRQYSLCGDPRDRKRYYIAVRANQNGRGGSLYIHQKLQVGDIVSVSLPRNLFPVASGKTFHHLLIAGGIGLTPFMSMIPVFLRTGQDFHLHACTKDMDHTPFRSQLEDLVTRGVATLYHGGRKSDCGLNLAQLLAVQPPNWHAYCCGPQGMIDQFVATTAGWAEGTVHFENFCPSAAVGTAYTLELPKSGISVEVMPNETMVAALLRNGIVVKTSCCAGVCGTCRLNYLDGIPDHRDYVLSNDERRTSLMPCVSGCVSSSLVLDI